MDIALPPDPPFRVITDLIREHARARPAQPALLAGDARLSYAELDALMDRVAASLQRDGLKPGDAIAGRGRAIAALGRDPGGVHRASQRRGRDRRSLAGVGQRSAGQDAAARQPAIHR